MADKFKVGDKVRITFSDEKRLIGEITFILSIDHKDNSYELDIPSTYGGKYKNKWSNGTGIEPVYDGDEASSWSECAWKPSWIKSHG